MDTFNIELIGDMSVGMQHEFGRLELPKMDLTKEEMREFKDQLQAFLADWHPMFNGVIVSGAGDWIDSPALQG